MLKRALVYLLGATLVAALALGGLWLYRAMQPQPLPPLTLADNADDLLVLVGLAPGQLRVNLLGIDRKPPASARVNLHLVPLDGQSGEARLAARASLFRRGEFAATGGIGSGRWRIDVIVVRPGKLNAGASFQLTDPQPAPPDLLTRVDSAMNQLKAMHQEQRLGYGQSAARSRADFVAPAHLHLWVSDGFERIVIGPDLYEKEPGQRWTKTRWPGVSPYAWPDSQFAAGGLDALVVDHEPVDGHMCLVVAFRDRPSGARFRLWVGEDDRLVRRNLMMAPGHYMQDDNTNFNGAISVTPPQD